MQCPCYVECKDCGPGFHKIIDLNNAGLIIYRHTTHTEDVDKKTGNIEHAVDTTDDVYILHNTRDTNISSVDYWPEIEQKEIKCPRCRKIKENAEKLLKKGPTISGNDVKGICDHCKMNGASCHGCQEIVKKFFPGKRERTDIGQERVKHWLGKIKLLLEDTSPEKKITDSDVPTTQFSRNLKKPVREPDVEQLYGPHELDSASTIRPSIDEKKKLLFPNLEKLETPVMIQGPLNRGMTSSLINKNMEISQISSNFSKSMLHTQPEKVKHNLIKPTILPNNKQEDSFGFEQIFDDAIPLTGTNQRHGREKAKDGIEKKPIRLEKQAPKDNYGKPIQLPDDVGQRSKETNLHQKPNLDAKVKDSQDGKKYRSTEALVTKVKDIRIGHLHENKIIFPRRSHKKFLTKHKSSSELIKHSAHMLLPKGEKSQLKQTKQQSDKIFAKHKVIGETTDTENSEVAKTDKTSSAAKSRQKSTLKADIDAQNISLKAEKDAKQANKEARQAEKDAKQANKDARQTEKDAKQANKDARQAEKDAKQANKDARQANKDARQAEKDARQAEKDAKQANKDARQGEKDARQGEKDARQAEKDAKQANKDVRQGEKDAKQANKDARQGEKDAKQANKDARQGEKDAKQANKDAQQARKYGQKDTSKSDKDAQQAKKDTQPALSDAQKDAKNEVNAQKAALIAEKNAKKAEKDAQRDAQKAERDAQKAERDAQKAERDAQKAALLLGKNSQKAEHDALQAKKDAQQAKHKAQKEAEKTEKDASKAEKTVLDNLKDAHKAEKLREMNKKESSDSLSEKPIKENRKDNKIKKIMITSKNKNHIKASLFEDQIENKGETLNPALDDLIAKLVELKQLAHKGKLHYLSPDLRMTQNYINAHCEHHSHQKNEHCLLCANSDIALQFASLCPDHEIKDEISEIIVGQQILKFRPPRTSIEEHLEENDTETNIEISPVRTEVTPQTGIGFWRYSLSDRKFIDNGWTQLPTEKVVRKMNVYRMRPARPEFDWFEHNKNKGLMTYDTGEKLAEFDDNGRGRWFYRNGRMALVYYDAEATLCVTDMMLAYSSIRRHSQKVYTLTEQHAGQRFVVYSNGEPDERGRSRPYTLLATFDYLGNGIVFDHSGKIRLKYNQTEGVVLDRSIGPVSHWKWHTLNDPPVLQQVMLDTQIPHKDPEIMKMGKPGEEKPRQEDEEMLAIEFDNIVKEKSKKLSQAFRPFQIKMKALKINEHFSLRVLDQATVYLLYRDGTTNLKLNIGMVLDNKEIVDTDTADVGDVSNNLEKLPARTESLAGLQKSVAIAQQYDRMRTERERKLRPAVPSASFDKLVAGISRPLPRQLITTERSGSSMKAADHCKCNRKPTATNVYYDTRFY